MIKNFNITDYNESGFQIIHKFLNNEFIDRLKTNLVAMTPKVNVPGSKSAWGYGNLINDLNFDFIYNHQYLIKILNEIHGPNLFINHLMVVNKVAWIGPDVEWHQEVANIDTYAAGISRDRWADFSQVFIALDPHTIDNGCLKIIPSSHKLGFMEHQDCINSHLNHKRRLTTESLEIAFSKYGIINVEMEPGDALFFNHLLMHGSSNNTSPINRMSLLIQARGFELDKDEKVFNNEVESRKNFVIQNLKDKIDQLVNKNSLYKDMHTKS